MIMIHPLRYKNLLTNKSRGSFVRHLLSGPLLLSGVVVIPIVDLWLETYHRVCFPLYGLKYIKRSKYIKVDRHKLSKLSLTEKFGCIYCGYANGWVIYAAKILQRTESYWCGIMHKKSNNYESPGHQKEFMSYEDYE